MADNKNFRKSLSDEQFDGISEGNSCRFYCDVLEGQFPCMGKCYGKRESIIDAIYYKTCIHCSIWTSLPDATSLEITYIFECSQFGYDIRIKE